MNEVHEVDNRYPEVAEPYERIRGGRHHGGLKSGRVNNLKRGFWATAAATVSVVTLLLAAPGGKPNAVEPTPFREPEIGIVAAAQSPTQADELDYQYRVVLNDAEELDVTVTARTESGELLAEAGPFHHTKSEDSLPGTVRLSRTEDIYRVVLELRCAYTREGAPREKLATVQVEMRNGPPEPVTEATGTESTEPETESAAPFVEPTLELAAVEPEDPELTALRYLCQIELHSAQEMELRAEVRDERGELLGTDGPYSHGAADTAQDRSIPLTWTRRPASLTLTVTGSYREEDGERSVSVTQTVDLPFEAPVLTLTEAALSGAGSNVLGYRYELRLNSAESLQVTAHLETDIGADLGTDGPYDHSDSGTAPAHDVVLVWTARPAAVTLTLTGVYTEQGQEKTITVSQTLEVLPYTAPTLTITEANLNGTAVTPLRYKYQVTLNSAERMEVRATVRGNTGESLGSDGPYTHTASESAPEHSAALRWSERPSSLTLTLTGSYWEDGVQKTVTASKTLNVPAPPFTAPKLSITEASLNGSDVSPLRYKYQVTLNSARNMEVSAVVTANGGTRLNTDGPYSHTASGTSPEHSVRLPWTTRPSSVTLTLTGTYTENGTRKTVTASKTLTVPAETFTPPVIYISSAKVDDMNSRLVVYSAGITMSTSRSVKVSFNVVDDDGVSYGTTGPFTYTASGSLSNQTIRCASYVDSDMTLVMTASYEINGETKTVTASKRLTDAEPFEWPEIELLDVMKVAGSVSQYYYNYNVVLNSASKLRVKAQFLDSSGRVIYETGYTEHTPSNDTGGSKTVDSGTPAATLRLVGEFDHLGTTYTVHDNRDISYMSIVWPNFRRLTGWIGSRSP